MYTIIFTLHRKAASSRLIWWWPALSVESFYQQRCLNSLFLTHDLLRMWESREAPGVAVYRVVVSGGQWEKRVSHVAFDQKGGQHCESPKAIHPTVRLLSTGHISGPLDLGVRPAGGQRRPERGGRRGWACSDKRGWNPRSRRLWLHKCKNSCSADWHKWLPYCQWHLQIIFPG